MTILKIAIESYIELFIAQKTNANHSTPTLSPWNVKRDRNKLQTREDGFYQNRNK